VCSSDLLIADNVNYVLGQSREKDNPDKVKDRHDAYCALIKECADTTLEPSVIAIRKWLDAGGPEDLRTKTDVSEDDDFTIEVDGMYPVDLPSVRSFWASRQTSANNGICLVTGQYGPVVDRMPVPIKGIPEGQVTGTALISVNNAAGESFGLSATLNSPISPGAAEAVCNGLNYLLASDVHSLRVGKAVYVFWTRENTEFSWDILKDPKPEDVQALLKSARTGKRFESVEDPNFFVLALSANASRIVVRDYHETTLDAVKASLKNWFEQLAIIGSDGGDAKPPGIFKLAASLFREAKDMPAHVPTALLNAAVNGAPLPDYLLGLAVRRNLAMQGPYAVYNKQRYLSVERMAIIKALLCKGKEIDLKGLNPQHPDAAYHCGRLLAVLERIQRAALGDINATVVDRYYGAACSSPGSILGNLVNDAQSHLGKLRKDHKDFHHQLRLEEVLSAIGEEFPKTLSLPRQGLFALGFYHQKADDRAQAATHKDKQSASDTDEGEEA
jgi:CRISPR-associated protein Csd1